MHKKIILRTTFILLILFISFPLYYILESVITSIVLKNIAQQINVIKPHIEYLSFSNLESVIKQSFNGSNYKIYASAKQTKGIANLMRGQESNLLIKNTDIANVFGTAQNDSTKDIYHFECEYLNISGQHNTIKLYKTFYIALELSKAKEVVEMNGDNITLDLAKSSIESTEPIVFNAKNKILVAGSFFYANNKIILRKEIFADSKEITISSNSAEITLTPIKAIVKNQKLAIENIKFHGNVNLFDRINNATIKADTVIFNQNKKIATLIGNVSIKRPDGTIFGEKLTYKLQEDFTKIEGKKSEMVEIKVNF